MTVKLIQILSDIQALIGDWNNRLVPTEDQFVEELKPLAQELYKEVKNQKLPVIEED